MMKRTFIPGSEWLYFKIYTGHKSADNLLIYDILPVVRELESEKRITNFFFLRYNDPKFHIRLRLRTGEIDHYGSIFRLIHDRLYPYVESGVIWDIQCNSYVREIERYGENTMEEAEALFGTDSRAVLGLLELSRESADEDEERWKLAILLIDRLLSAALPDTDRKNEFMEGLSLSFKNEFHFVSSDYTKQLNLQFRELHPKIERLFAREDAAMEKYGVILQRRDAEMAPVLDRFLSLEGSGKLAVPFDNLLQSLIHMTMNRLFRSKNRIFELVVYTLLSKYYQAALSRRKYLNAQP